MNSIPKSVRDLIENFEKLPGIGPKTAQRLTYYLLHAPRSEAEKLANAAIAIKDKTVLCSICCNVAETDPCSICSDSSRDRSVIAVVEDPLDVLALERASYNGLYHVLHGRIAPLDNIGPDELMIKQILPRLRQDVVEVIMATNPTMEGEATAMYIERLIKPLGVKITRIARGLPVGGDLEYADESTLRKSLDGRMEV